jgi:hypothetical protein
MASNDSKITQDFPPRYCELSPAFEYRTNKNEGHRRAFASQNKFKIEELR